MSKIYIEVPKTNNVGIKNEANTASTMGNMFR